MGRCALAALLAACLLGSAGCATTSAPGDDVASAPRNRVKFMRTQVGDRVTLQWESNEKTSYSVVYTTSLLERRPWKPLPEFTDLPGTGSTMTIVFTSPEPGTLYYRLTEKPLP